MDEQKRRLLLLDGQTQNIPEVDTQSWLEWRNRDEGAKLLSAYRRRP